MNSNENICEGNSVVECQLPKLNVAGSSPVPRFKIVSSPVFILIFLFAFIFGCASIEELPGGKASTPLRGTYHKVRPGETLWRIAKMYDVSVEDIVAANKIPNVALIEKNQLLFIPGAKAKKEIPAGTEKPFVKSSGDFVWPLRGEIVAYFGEQKDAWVNNGINIKSGAGAKVAAARGGRVVFADHLSGYGETVILDHQDRFFTVYSQNAATLLVKLDDVVAQGAPIAESRGAPFLHFEIRKNAVATNPLYYLP